MVVIRKKANDKSFGPQDGTIEMAILARKYRLIFPESQQISVKGVDVTVLDPLGKIQFALLKSFLGARIVVFDPAQRKIGPLGEKFFPAIAYLSGYFGFVVGKK